jgi:YVTN family beta-propeller protein
MAIHGKKSAMAGDSTTFSRRALLGGLVVSACGRKRATRYQGWLFVAGGAEKEIAVADLASFRRVASIPLPFTPDQLFYSGGRVFAMSREGQGLIEIELERFRVTGRIGLPGRPIAARLVPDATTALILTEGPDSLVRVDLAARRVTARLPLSGTPQDLDTDGMLAAVSIPGRNVIVRAGVLSGGAGSGLKFFGSTDTGMPCGTIRLRKDGKTILAGATAAREIVAIDAKSGNVLTRLPLPVSPGRFCFNGDGGQMFVTGAGEDALAIVSPYQNEVDQTILAGRTPFGMAVSERRNMLFVTNPESGDMTILDIDTRSVSASVHVGENPGEVMLTPDGEYALVMAQRSGNVSVVRIATVLDKKAKTSSPPSPLFTVFPTAADARSALIVPFQS